MSIRRLLLAFYSKFFCNNDQFSSIQAIHVLGRGFVCFFKVGKKNSRRGICANWGEEEEKAAGERENYKTIQQQSASLHHHGGTSHRIPRSMIHQPDEELQGHQRKEKWGVAWNPCWLVYCTEQGWNVKLKGKGQSRWGILLLQKPCSLRTVKCHWQVAHYL